MLPVDTGRDDREAMMVAGAPVRQLRLQRALGSKRTYVLTEGGTWVCSIRLGRFGTPATVELGGDGWEVAVRRLIGARVTVTNAWTGAVVAHKAARTLEIVGGPRLRWRRRSAARPRPAFHGPDGRPVAQYTTFDGEGLTVDVSSGEPRVDLLCAVVGSMLLLPAVSLRPR